MGSWTLEDAQAAVQKYIDETPLKDIEVKAWTKEMDLANLTDKKCRTINAAHLYVDLDGIENKLPSEPTDDEYKQLLQALHAYMRVAIEAVESKVDGLKVQFQGSRLHAIIYRPYGDEAAICEAAVAALCYLRLFVRDHFAAKFPDYSGLKLYAGLDWGPALVTGLGRGDDRAVLFIGDAANMPAKALTRQRALVLEAGALEKLDGGKLDDYVDADDNCMNMASETKLLGALGLTTDVKDLGKTLDECVTSYPLDKITIRMLTSDVDWERLGPTENRKIKATSIFADLSGFTAFVEGRLGDEEKLKEAVQILHVIRREFCRVAYLYGYDRVAYQGDRIQAFRRNDLDPGAEAVEACVAMRESLAAVVHDKLSASKDLGVAIGTDSGEILLSRVGKIGDRERVCLGRSARSAAQMEERLASGKVGISASVREVLTEDARDVFVWSATDKAYVNEDASVADLQTLLIDEKTHSLKPSERGIEVVKSAASVSGGMPYVTTNSWVER